MKNLSIAAAVALTLIVSKTAFPQITIAVDDLDYQEGESYKMYGRNTLYIVQGLTGKIGGPHTWNFSNGPTDVDYTYDYVLPASTPCSADFPLASIAEKRTGDGSEAFLFLGFEADTGRINYGACQPGVLTIPYIFNPPIIDFPETINYIDSWTGSTSFPAKSGGFDVDVDYTYVSFCNAYGTLTLPDGLGDFPCLQVNNLEHFEYYWSGILIAESYIRSFYWLIEDAGIAVIIVSEEGNSAPPENFAYSAGYNRMYESSKLITSHEFNLNLFVNLEGPYNSNSGMMNTSLNPSILPLNQPFNMPPWNYMETETVSSFPTPDIVEWVLIELHDTTQASFVSEETKIARQAAFIKNDGLIVGLDGTTIPLFDVPINNDLFVVLRQRNHLDILSALPLINVGGNYGYNFTTGPEKAFGGTAAQKEISTNVWGMISGDANADGTISDLDLSEHWENNAGLSAYDPGDLNLDGQVDNKDKDDFWWPNQGEGSQIPD